VKLEREELLDLVRTLAEAVSDAQVELGQLAEPGEDDWPEPGFYRELREEHAALKATLMWVRSKAAVGETIAEGALTDRYRTERDRIDIPDRGHPKMPVADEVRDHLQRAEEELRRAVVLDGDVRDVMRYANLRDTFAGC
jgi:hypothetical protein